MLFEMIIPPFFCERGQRERQFESPIGILFNLSLYLFVFQDFSVQLKVILVSFGIIYCLCKNLSNIFKYCNFWQDIVLTIKSNILLHCIDKSTKKTYIEIQICIYLNCENILAKNFNNMYTH